MTDREQAYFQWLRQACLLLAVEARDHEQNRQFDDRKQRLEIAKILQRFVREANAFLEEAEPVE